MGEIITTQLDIIRHQSGFHLCRKAKIKVITLANHKGHSQYGEPIKARDNVSERVTTGLI